jgi:hypothetical protein
MVLSDFYLFYPVRTKTSHCFHQSYTNPVSKLICEPPFITPDIAVPVFRLEFIIRYISTKDFCRHTVLASELGLNRRYLFLLS